MITATLLRIFKMWTQPSSLSREEEIKKTWYLYTVEHDSAIKEERNQVYLVSLNHFPGMKSAQPQELSARGKPDFSDQSEWPRQQLHKHSVLKSLRRKRTSPPTPPGMRMATTTKVAVWVFLKQLKKKGQKELGTFRSTTHKRNLQIV